MYVIIKMSIKSIIMEYLLESSSPDDDDEIYALLGERKNLPRVKNFIETVIHQYSNKEIRGTILDFLFLAFLKKFTFLVQE